jgi:hypothetical protein
MLSPFLVSTLPIPYPFAAYPVSMRVLPHPPTHSCLTALAFLFKGDQGPPLPLMPDKAPSAQKHHDWLASTKDPYELWHHKNHLACATHDWSGHYGRCFVSAAQYLALGDSVLPPALATLRAQLAPVHLINPTERQSLQPLGLIQGKEQKQNSSNALVPLLPFYILQY